MSDSKCREAFDREYAFASKDKLDHYWKNQKGSIWRAAYKACSSEYESKLAVAREALEYIAAHKWAIGIPKWDAEFVDVAEKAIKDLSPQHGDESGK